MWDQEFAKVQRYKGLQIIQGDYKEKCRAAAPDGRG